MRKSRFTESQIVGILKEGEAGVPLADLVRVASRLESNYSRTSERGVFAVWQVDRV